jgi:hypothetical protein
VEGGPLGPGMASLMSRLEVEAIAENISEDVGGYVGREGRHVPPPPTMYLVTTVGKEGAGGEGGPAASATAGGAKAIGEQLTNRALTDSATATTQSFSSPGQLGLGGGSMSVALGGSSMGGGVGGSRQDPVVPRYDSAHLYNIQCSEIFTLRNEKLHTEN